MFGAGQTTLDSNNLTPPVINSSPLRPNLRRIGEHEIARTLQRIRPFTMVPDDGLTELAWQVQILLKHGIRGDFVECGAWRGGASFLIADLLRKADAHDRKVWLLDSFEGAPAPEEIDGEAALSWAKNTSSPSYFDNCRASLEEVQRTASELGLASYTKFVKGWFEQTLPDARGRIGPIVLLRIDCDWYSSVQVCLQNLYDQVVEGGLIILDDYYTWDGCAVALHEFLGKRGLAHRIETVPGPMALFRKARETWHQLKAIEGSSDTKSRHLAIRLLNRVKRFVAPTP